jgi:restriction system protein
MPGITNRRQGELLRATFDVLIKHPEGLPGREVLAQMAQSVEFNEYELGHYASSPDDPRAFKATRFWTVNCVKAGWMTKSKGTWQLTDAGREAYARFPDPGDFIRESSRLYSEWRAARPERVAESQPSGTSDEEAIEEREAASTTLEEATERAWLQVQDYLMAMDAYDFQDLVAALLRAMGYHVYWVSPPGPDRGLDILAFTDPLGATGPRIKGQVKRRQEKTTADGLRSFMAILGPQGRWYLPLGRRLHHRRRTRGPWPGEPAHHLDRLGTISSTCG